MKSAKPKSNFALNPTNGRPVDILSVSSEGQLLVGQSDERQLHVYSADYSHVTSINLPDNDEVYEAVWTSVGNIVYSEWRKGLLVTMSRSGAFIQQANVLNSRFLSVSSDNFIYLTSGYTS